MTSVSPNTSTRTMRKMGSSGDRRAEVTRHLRCRIQPSVARGEAERRVKRGRHGWVDPAHLGNGDGQPSRAAANAEGTPSHELPKCVPTGVGACDRGRESLGRGAMASDRQGVARVPLREGAIAAVEGIDLIAEARVAGMTPAIAAQMQSMLRDDVRRRGVPRRRASAGRRWVRQLMLAV